MGWDAPAAGSPFPQAPPKHPWAWWDPSLGKGRCQPQGPPCSSPSLSHTPLLAPGLGTVSPCSLAPHPAPNLQDLPSPLGPTGAGGCGLRCPPGQCQAAGGTPQHPSATSGRPASCSPCSPTFGGELWGGGGVWGTHTHTTRKTRGAPVLTEEDGQEISAADTRVPGEGAGRRASRCSECGCRKALPRISAGTQNPVWKLGGTP